MAVKCPNCHFDNPEDTNFCGKCATPLTPAGQPSSVLTKTLETPTYVLSKGILIAGKYRILEEIGRGGMGVVYKAEDTKLARNVAIKALPEIFTTDPERMARFDREAKVLATLNHPNIAAIHGIEEAEGKRFLVLEFVEGETLAERLIRGPLSLEETLDVCRQIAEGLEGAHEKNIIHRDLKPSNIKITPDGKAKILDFGLARVFHGQISDIDLAKSPTITADMTQPGVILGTAAYMSPEQAKGKAVEKRADIWAFGCILYECLVGKRLFRGDTATEIIADILKGDPDWNLLPADTPGNVGAVLRRCLQRDPHRRLRDIGDARLELEAPAAYPSEAAPAARRFSIRWWVVGTVVVLLAGILADRMLIRRPSSTYSAPVVRTIIKIEPGHWLAGMLNIIELFRPVRTALSISNDGKFLVYSAIAENPGPQAIPRLFLRRLDQLKAKPISGTEGGLHPFLSSDGRWLGFWTDGKLKKVSIEGGAPTVLCETPSIYGASWGPDNRIVFASDWEGGLSMVSAEGGKPEILTEPDPQREESSHRLPFWLPDGKGVLFTIMKHGFDPLPSLALLRLDKREWKVLLPAAADAKYVPTGHLVFLREGTLMAVRFDLARLEVVGQPAALVENIVQALAGSSSIFHTGAGQFGISESGTLVYAEGGIVPNDIFSLVWVDQQGNEQPAMAIKDSFFAPRLSPEGRKIAYGTLGREWCIWVYDLIRGTNSRLVSDGRALFPIWAPDGKRLLFSWHKSLTTNLFWQPPDGSSAMARLTNSERNQWPSSCSPDGKTVALVEMNPDTGMDIVVLDVATNHATPFLNSRFNEQYPEFSPDGRWIAYTSNESSRTEVYVRSFPGSEVKFQVSHERGQWPMWARNGRQLFYKWQDKYWAVDIRTDGEFSISKPRLLFDKSGYGAASPIRGYDLSLDSQRFLMVKDEVRKPQPITEMILVQNWFEELKRLVPTGKK